MFKFIVICALLATACAKSPARGVSKPASASSDDAHAEVLSAASDVRADGFEYHLETSNSISSKASGDNEGRIKGEFQWVSPEGEQIALNYVADENGYQPNSASLPVPPPIPAAILRAIQYIESHAPQPEGKNGRKL